MKKERDEKLKIEKVAKNKTRRTIVIMDVIICVIWAMVFIPAMSSSVVLEIISIILMIAFVNWFLKISLYQTYISEDEHKISKEYVSKYLKSETETEIIPIASNYYKSLITDILPRKARFYAIMFNDDYVEIFIKFNEDTEEVYFDKIHQVYFKKYYVVKEELASRIREEFNFEEDKKIEVIASPNEKYAPLAKEWLEKDSKVKARYYAKESEGKILVEVANENGKIVGEPVKYENCYAFYSNYEPKDE